MFSFRPKPYHWVLLVALLSFLVFQWFSVTTSAQNQQRLDQIKDTHFPTLEVIDQNIAGLERIRELFLQSVLTGEAELVVEANSLTRNSIASLENLKTINPAIDQELSALQKAFEEYASISSETALALIDSAETDVSRTERMIQRQQQLQRMVDSLRDNSYRNFNETLSNSETAASHLHSLGIALGLMNLGLIAVLVYFAASNTRMIAIIEGQNQTLEDRVTQRTQELESAQRELIKAEKFAALGGLVSGVAHEINTPLGVSITASSHLAEEVRLFNRQFEQASLKKSVLKEFIDNMDEGTTILQSNLKRASELIKNFKQVAVDQSVEDSRKIDLGAYFEEVLSSLRPQWKHTRVSVNTDFTQKIEIETYPGVWAQILTNLVTNSIQHGYQAGELEGEIRIKLQQKSNTTYIYYDDYGKGMDDDALAQVYDPFFTTSRGHGGTGLGMHIVYNLVTQKLAGQIECQSSPGQGCHIVIKLPMPMRA